MWSQPSDHSYSVTLRERQDGPGTKVSSARRLWSGGRGKRGDRKKTNVRHWGTEDSVPQNLSSLTYTLWRRISGFGVSWREAPGQKSHLFVPPTHPSSLKIGDVPWWSLLVDDLQPWTGISTRLGDRRSIPGLTGRGQHGSICHYPVSFKPLAPTCGSDPLRPTPEFLLLSLFFFNSMVPLP